MHREGIHTYIRLPVKCTVMLWETQQRWAPQEAWVAAMTGQPAGDGLRHRSGGDIAAVVAAAVTMVRKSTQHSLQFVREWMDA